MENLVINNLNDHSVLGKIFLIENKLGIPNPAALINDLGQYISSIPNQPY